MASQSIDRPVIFIVGPTASGKTNLAISLAKKYNGEIICADSRTIYRKMDIGTAKPTIEEQHQVKHWGIDICDVGDRFTAADFQKYAKEKIASIQKRGMVPFVVGGSGLYIDSLLYDYSFAGGYDQKKRQILETQTVEELQKYCLNNNIKLPNNSKNRRYIIRAIEKNGNRTDKKAVQDNYIVVGISTNRDVLIDRITKRAEQIFSNGIVDEAKMLGDIYGWSSEAMTANIYHIVQDYLRDEITYDEAIANFILDDLHLAKKQITWFKRNKHIRWYSLDGAETYISRLLSLHNQ